MASAYQFSQADAKTRDHFFKGFPSYWNILVFYLFMCATPAWVNLLFVWGFAISVFIPVKYVYPSRTVKLRAATLALTVAWTTVLGIVIALYSEAPGAWAHRFLAWASLVYVVYYFGISFYFTWKHGFPRQGA